MFEESKEIELRESNSKYQSLMRDYVKSQNQLVLTRIDLNNQIKQSKKDNELFFKQKDDRIEQLEKELKDFKG